MPIASINVNCLSLLWTKHGEQFVSAVARIVFILVAYFIIRYVLFKLINRIFSLPLARTAQETSQTRTARVRALQSVLRSATGFILGLIAVIMVLQAAGINILPLITTASVAGLAIGFGAQKLVRDQISGFFILMEDQYGIGDYVTINTVTGVVEELGMRITRIRDSSGKLYVIANGDIAQVCNFSRGNLTVSFDVAVPASADIEKTRQVLNEIGESLAKEMPSQIVEPLHCDGLTQVSGATATIRLVGCILPPHQDAVQLELNSRIREVFKENDLQLA